MHDAENTDNDVASKRQYIQNIGLVMIAGQAGCWTVVIVLFALFVGLLLDSFIGFRGPFTIGMLILSIPVSLFVMLRISLSAINKINNTDSTKE